MEALFFHCQQKKKCHSIIKFHIPFREKNQGQDLEKGSEGKTEGSLEVQPASSSKEKEVVNVTDQRAANYNGGNNNTHAHSAIPEKLSSRSSLIASSLSAFPIIPSWEGKTQEMKTEKAKEENNKKFAKPAIISLGLILAPDLSALGFTGPYKPGLMAGMSTIYNLNTRWGLSLGLMAGKKVYDGKDEYKPDGYGTSYSGALEKIEASCLVLDIPLNLRYNFVHKDDHNFFVSSGISSYIMLFIARFTEKNTAAKSVLSMKINIISASPIFPWATNAALAADFPGKLSLT